MDLLTGQFIFTNKQMKHDKRNDESKTKAHNNIMLQGYKRSIGSQIYINEHVQEMEV